MDPHSLNLYCSRVCYILARIWGRSYCSLAEDLSLLFSKAPTSEAEAWNYKIISNSSCSFDSSSGLNRERMKIPSVFPARYWSHFKAPVCRRREKEGWCANLAIQETLMYFWGSESSLIHFSFPNWRPKWEGSCWGQQSPCPCSGKSWEGQSQARRPSMQVVPDPQWMFGKLLADGGEWIFLPLLITGEDTKPYGLKLLIALLVWECRMDHNL